MADVEDTNEASLRCGDLRVVRSVDGARCTQHGERCDAKRLPDEHV